MTTVSAAPNLGNNNKLPVKKHTPNKPPTNQRSSFYASTVSFGVGTLCLIILNLIINPHMLTPQFFTEQTIKHKVPTPKDTVEA
jgi:hypothetical protein